MTICLVAGSKYAANKPEGVGLIEGILRDAADFGAALPAHEPNELTKRDATTKPEKTSPASTLELKSSFVCGCCRVKLAHVFKDQNELRVTDTLPYLAIRTVNHCIASSNCLLLMPLPLNVSWKRLRVALNMSFVSQ